jgi:hypothetical protein
MGYSASTLDYFSSLSANLLSASLRNLDELTMVLTPGELRMSDAERLAAIDRIDRAVADRLGCCSIVSWLFFLRGGQVPLYYDFSGFGL